MAYRKHNTIFAHSMFMLLPLMLSIMLWNPNDTLYVGSSWAAMIHLFSYLNVLRGHLNSWKSCQSHNDRKTKKLSQRDSSDVAIKYWGHSPRLCGDFGWNVLQEAWKTDYYFWWLAQNRLNRTWMVWGGDVECSKNKTTVLRITCTEALPTCVFSSTGHLCR